MNTRTTPTCSLPSVPIRRALRPRHQLWLATAAIIAVVGGAPLFGVTAAVAQHKDATADKEDSSVLVRVRVELKPEPTKALGLILSTTGVQQIGSTAISKVGEKLYDVSFKVDRQDLKEDSVATALAVNADGQSTFSNVTPVLLSDSRSMLAAIPECPGEDPTQIAVLNQLGPLQQLVEVRSERLTMARVKLSRALDAELITKLSRFEDYFGLDTSAGPLSSELPPALLLDRLARINYALSQYRGFKKTEKSAKK
jgi:hypothetical protein